MSRRGCRYNFDSADRELAKEPGHLDYLAGRFTGARSPRLRTTRLKAASDPTARGAISGPLLGASPW